VVIAMVGAGFVADLRLSAVERELAKLSNVIVQEARFEERLTEIARRVDRLETPNRRP
jgi:hypothetical protein